MEFNIESVFPGILSDFLQPFATRFTLTNILLGVIVFVLLLILFVLCCCCRRLTNISSGQPGVAQ